MILSALQRLSFGILTPVPKVRLGSEYGGWFLHPAAISRRSIVYSFGIGEDVSFECELIKTCGASVHAFDPTPRAQAWIKTQNLPRELHTHDFGLSARDGELRVYPPVDTGHVSFSLVRRGNTAGAPADVPVRRLSTIAQSLGHKQIDVLKMDIEGAEYETIPEILASGVPVTQWLIEFHHRFPEFRFRQTRAAVKQLESRGYRLFAISRSGQEFSFIHSDALDKTGA